MYQQQDVSTSQYTSVLLVCIYNKASTIITHDMLYQIFAQYSEVMRILIFIIAKVWKAFVEMDSLNNSKHAAQKLNNTLLFNDGSKMTIFPSKLQKVNFQNGNNGGVNYEQLRKMSQSISTSQNQNRTYNSEGFQCYYSKSDTFKSQSMRRDTLSTMKQSQNTCISLQESFSKYQDDDWFSSLRNRKREPTWKSWYDIESQYEQLAMQSQQYRFLISRPKSKTTVLPLNQKQQSHLFDIANSKVLFIRSLMSYCTIKFIYNILSNFGNVIKIVHLVQKQSMLVQFEHIQDAIQAKDFLNLVKNSFKIFFSHYNTLNLRQPIEGEQTQQYTISTPKKEHFNPPSEILHISYISQSSQEQFLKLVKQYGIVNQIKWQKHHNNKSMLLIRLNNIQQSMKVMGFLQGKKIGNKFIKISFTRSKFVN